MWKVELMETVDWVPSIETLIPGKVILGSGGKEKAWKWFSPFPLAASPQTPFPDLSLRTQGNLFISLLPSICLGLFVSSPSNLSPHFFFATPGSAQGLGMQESLLVVLGHPLGCLDQT